MWMTKIIGSENLSHELAELEIRRDSLSATY
jgi:hypothetical protein